MGKIRKMLTILFLNILLLSGTIYLTDKWGHLQPVLLIGGIIGIFVVFTLTDMRLKIHFKNFILYSIFITCCLFSALVNEDVSLCAGALALYLIYLALAIVYPSICNRKGMRYNSNRIICYSYIYSHLPIIVLPLITKGINKIPYSGVFFNPNSYGAISSTIYIIVFSRFSYTMDRMILDGKIKIAQVLLNSLLLLSTFTLTMISRSRTSFFSILCITAFYMMISFSRLMVKGRLKISVLVRAILVFIIVLSISTFVIIQTGIFQLFQYTIVNKMVIKSDDMLSGRTDIWYRTVVESRLFGNGRDYFGSFGTGAYNTYISLLGQYGVIPTVIYCSFLINLLYYSIIYIKRNNEDEYRYYPAYSTLLFILLSMGEGMFFMDIMFLTFAAIGSIFNNLIGKSEISKFGLYRKSLVFSKI